MSKQPENNISDIFKSNFEEQAHLDQGWNNPPEFVFEEAMNTINNGKKRKKRTVLLFSLVALAISAILLNQYYFNNRLEKIESKLDKIVTTEQEVLSQTTIEQEITTGQAPTIIANRNTEKTNSAISSSINNLKSEFATNKKVATTTKNTSTIPLVNNSQIKVENKVLANSKHFQKINLLETVETIKSTGLVHEQSQILIAKDPTVVEHELTEVPRRTKLGFRIESNLSTLTMSAPIGNQSISLYDKYYRGLSLHLDYSVNLSKRWEWINSVGFSKISNHSLTENTFDYQKGIEKMMPNNMATYEMDNAIESPLGTLEQRMRLVVDPSHTMQGDKLYQAINLDQCITTINISSGFSYRLLDKNRFSWSTSLQTGFNIILGLESKMHSQYEMHDMIMSETDNTFNKATNTNQFYTSINLGSALTYKISESFQFNFGLGHNRGLSSLREDLNNSSKTYLNNWTSHIGVSKLF